MSLHKEVVDGIKDAMRNKDKVRLATLRDAKSKFVLEQTKTGTSDELDDSEVIKILSKLQRQRLDTAEIYKGQGREDLAEDELAQAEVLADFLPKALTEDEVREKVSEIITRELELVQWLIWERLWELPQVKWQDEQRER